MNPIRITGTAILSLLLGIAAPAYAQQEQRDKQDHPQQQESKHEQAKPEHAQQQQHAQQQRQDQNNREQHAQQRGNDHPQRTQGEQRIEHSAWREHRSQRWDSDHRNWQQRGGYNGYRIPDDRYRGYFGRDHEFRIYGLPFLVVG